MLKKGDPIICPSCNEVAYMAAKEISTLDQQGSVRQSLIDQRTMAAAEWYPLIVAVPLELAHLADEMSVVDLRCSFCGYGLLKEISRAIFEGKRATFQGTIEHEPEKS